MGHTRVIFADSTSAECYTILKMFDYTEDQKSQCWFNPEEQSIKVYIVWGKADYYPALLRRLSFGPRVQIHLKTRDQVEKIDALAREAVVALKNLDPNTHIQVFNADTMEELLF